MKADKIIRNAKIFTADRRETCACHVTNARIEAMPEDVAKVAALQLIWRLQYECI